MSSSLGCFFVLRTNQALIIPIAVLPSGYSMLNCCSAMQYSWHSRYYIWGYAAIPWKDFIVFGTTYGVVLKALPKLQPPICISWWVTAARDRQTDQHASTYSLCIASFFLSLFLAQRLSRDVPADADFLSDKIVPLGTAIKETLGRPRCGMDVR